MVEIGLSIRRDKLSFARPMFVAVDSSNESKGTFKSSFGTADSPCLILIVSW